MQIIFKDILSLAKTRYLFEKVTVEKKRYFETLHKSKKYEPQAFRSDNYTTILMQ